MLGIKRDATEDEIAQAYKRLALRWHHKFSKEDKTTSFHHFCEIS
jgi:DnaJ-class molecular chaperone